MTVYITYGGFLSDPFKVTIDTITAAKAGTTDLSYMGGYSSTTYWALSDPCHGNDVGLDANEVFGIWFDDYFAVYGIHNNWGVPTPKSSYNSVAQIQDTQYIALASKWVPQPTTPQFPNLSTVKVLHDETWTAYLGSPSFGKGIPIVLDTQQYYIDHGRHQ